MLVDEFSCSIVLPYELLGASVEERLDLQADKKHDAQLIETNKIQLNYAASLYCLVANLHEVQTIVKETFLRLGVHINVVLIRTNCERTN